MTPDALQGDGAESACVAGGGTLAFVASEDDEDELQALLDTSGVKQAWVATVMNASTANLFTSTALENYNSTRCVHFHTSLTSTANHSGALAQRRCDTFTMHAACADGTPTGTFEPSSLYAAHDLVGLPFASYSYGALL